MDPSRPRRRVSRAERERQILDAAVAVFGERGYQAASMDVVAERVGVTKPVLYAHFGSKEGLLLACIARARAELLEVTTAAAASAHGPEEMLRRGTLAFFEYLERREPAWTLLYSESTVAGEALEGIRAQQTDFIAALLAAQAPDAEPQRLAGWAQVIVGACERLALWRGSERTVTSEQATGYLMDLVWTGLSAVGSTPAQSSR
ncbi:TetR/AcrR family transcriptional regulator [Pseudonocardia alaniniphila]|uniref:TetR/AcrR family transcriptional regulator n=1 Tax=Pseudonocardia alaniniphila TaxID=75291 RepID=A0ABS9TA13_9PSEU|nr:TetR/AcrR family transcriptional regulator [Pseudonocardia alaniniphila]MCH6165341.1 TetR/AcrR family transcriptional regulator [Pseudonocardia alaniniphila]